ncbi:MAG: RAQPRD family integrative conjugative element protein [Gammaproteobacteria bacterium]|nr:RAQPRD family integrative conjugative element protein [Gammaproteobacteria bacterium]
MKARISSLLLGMALVMSSPAYATEPLDPERAALARIHHELAALEALIREAEAAGAQGRVRFQYDWLRADVRRIQAGLDEYLLDPPVIPRRVEPLAGDYRR